MTCDRCTYDQPHTHDETKWVEGDWATVEPGDRVNLTNADGAVEFTVGTHYQTRDCWRIDSQLASYAELHWNLFVEAPPTPQPIEFPNEAGIYVTRGEQEWNKTPLFKVAGGWQFANGQDATETARMWHADAGLIRLEPRNETAKAVLAAVRHCAINQTADTLTIRELVLENIGNDFGVTDA